MKPELSDSARVLNVAFVLGLRDVKNTYNRSKLGFFRLFLQTSLSIIIIVPIFATIQERNLREFLGYVASGLMIWSFISDSTIDASSAYLRNARTIRQVAIPRITFALQGIIRNAVMLAISLSLFPLIWIISGTTPNWNTLLLPFGLLLTILCIANLAIIVATIGARSRDFTSIVAAVMRVLFFLSPIIWVTERIRGDIAHFILGLNPFYHLLQIVRLPLLGEAPTNINWLLAIVAVVISGAIAYRVFKKFDHKIAYWV